jgi:hypothetical protein
LVLQPEGKVQYHLEQLDVEGIIILKCTLQKQDERAWTESTWFKIETGG